MINEFRVRLVNKCLKNDMESTNHYVHVKCPHDCGAITASFNRARIAGGKDALEESHPWMVGLYLNGTFVCAGSILKRTSVEIKLFQFQILNLCNTQCFQDTKMILLCYSSVTLCSSIVG
jgi:hypothetical protein